jgi:hypothetical protein
MSVRLWEQLAALEKTVRDLQARVAFLEKGSGVAVSQTLTRDDRGTPQSKLKLSRQVSQ